MSIAVTGGSVAERGQDWYAAETLAQSTATAAQSITLTTPLTILTGGTATGFTVNGFALADGTEGQRKSVIMSATGEAKLFLTGTATGAWVFSAADDRIEFTFENAKWRPNATSGATTASST